MDERITLDYGSGGKKTSSLIEEMIVPLFQNEALCELDDGAVTRLGAGDIVVYIVAKDHRARIVLPIVVRRTFVAVRTEKGQEVAVGIIGEFHQSTSTFSFAAAAFITFFVSKIAFAFFCTMS